MGERSKIIGEFGERTVENFLKLIGWGETPKNIEVPCSKPQKHSRNENGNRITHGLDFHFSYKSPLVDGILKSISISVKYTSNPYPNSPVTAFKEYFDDLTSAIECFKYSTIKHKVTEGITGYSKVEEVGILFWLSNSVDTYDDLIGLLANINLSNDNAFDAVFLVDNKRIEFIHSAIKHSGSLYPNAEVLFYYPDTGKNIIPTEKQNCGRLLPVEYINSSVLAMRLDRKDTGQIELLVYTIDPFSSSDLQRLIGLSQTISKSWATRVIIAFPDYNELTHGMDVRSVKSSFENKLLIDKVQITSYNTDFKSLQQ